MVIKSIFGLPCCVYMSFGYGEYCICLSGIFIFCVNCMKLIFVTGGVISGLGKGITAASIGRLLKSA